MLWWKSKAAKWSVAMACALILSIWLGPFLFAFLPYQFVGKRNYSGNCLDNLRRIGKAIDLYFESEAALPPAGQWMDRVAQYLRAADMDRSESAKVLHCPDVAAGFGYAMSAEAVKGKQDAPLIYDSEKTERNAFDRKALQSIPKRHRPSGNNILWADGHTSAR